MKEKIHIACLNLIQQKIDELRSALDSAQEAGNNETKSSAGDKHETGRAMMQLEQEKLSKQLNEVLDQRSDLEKIDLNVRSETIRKGSLVKTNKGYFYMSVGLGKINIGTELVYAVSPQSPFGLKLGDLKVNDKILMNSLTYLIESII